MKEIDVQGVPEQFTDEKDNAQFRHLPQLPGVELYHAHISRYAFEPHTHEAFGIGTVTWGAERFRYRGVQHVAATDSLVLMNPDELHTGEAATEDGWQYRMIYLTLDNQAGKVYELAGDHGWTLAELTAELTKQSGKTVVYQNLPEADFKAALLGAGLPEGLAAMLANSDVGASKGGLFDDSHQLSALIGRPTTPLAESMRAAL